jgi:hypothetical protein
MPFPFATRGDKAASLRLDIRLANDTAVVVGFFAIPLMTRLGASHLSESARNHQGIDNRHLSLDVSNAFMVLLLLQVGNA